MWKIFLDIESGEIIATDANKEEVLASYPIDCPMDDMLDELEAKFCPRDKIGLSNALIMFQFLEMTTGDGWEFLFCDKFHLQIQ